MSFNFFKAFYKRNIAGITKPIFTEESYKAMQAAENRIPIQNPYHHNFQLNYKGQRNAKKIVLDIFDLARIFAAAFFVIKIGMKLPSYYLFKRTQYTNNPDYMLCDAATFEKMDK